MKSLNTRNPPPGAWIKEENNQISIGANTVSKNILYFTIPFLGLWVGFVGYYVIWLETIQNGYYIEAPIVALLLILFFITIFILIMYQHFMKSFGRVEFIIDKGVVTLFRGFGKFGFTKVFLLKDIQYIHKQVTTEGPTYYKVALKHKKKFSFGHLLSEEKGDFLYETLLTLKKNGL